MEEKAKQREIRRIKRRIEELSDWIEIETELITKIDHKLNDPQILECKRVLLVWERDNHEPLIRDYNYQIWACEHELSIVKSTTSGSVSSQV